MSVTIVSFGAGDNSGAMLLGMYERRERPDAILFADTGGEKPNTYSFLWAVQRWIDEIALHWPSIQVVYKVDFKGERLTLEDYSLRSQTLPSIAYGLRSCSQKFKHQPQEKWANHWWLAQREWKQGRKIIKCLGIHAGEAHRATIKEDDKYIYRYPLIEWGWDSKRCVQEFAHRGWLTAPGKSACFFCPGSKVHEVFRLKRDNPDLFNRAVAIEERAQANLKTVVGLGRRWTWEEVGKYYMDQGRLFPDPPEMPCMCMDGE